MSEPFLAKHVTAANMAPHVYSIVWRVRGKSNSRAKKFPLSNQNASIDSGVELELVVIEIYTQGDLNVLKTEFVVVLV